MMRTLSKLALGTALVILVSPPDILAGRGGGGGGNRGGGGGYRGGGGGGMGGTPSFSQPHSPMNQSGAHPQYGNTSGAGGGAGYANRNQSQAHPAGAAAAGAGYANATRAWLTPGLPGPPPARAMPITISAWLTPVLRVLLPARAMPITTGAAYPYAGAAAAGAGYANTVPSRHGQRLLERKRLCCLRHGRLRHRGRRLGSRLADVWLGLFGL